MEEDANHDSNANDAPGECFVGKEDGVDAATTMEEDANHEADSGVGKSVWVFGFGLTLFCLVPSHRVF